jgi:hypothetical protein
VLTYSALVSSRFVPIDLTDYGQVLDAMLGVEDRYALGLFGPALHEEPARALRQVAPDAEDGDGERRSEQEAEPPADRDGQRVEELGGGT